jgi:DNA invertase Pin-like site-specific DNA recombinase
VKHCRMKVRRNLWHRHTSPAGARVFWEPRLEQVGKNSDREQFKLLFKAVSRREFELVLFWSLDRFSREGVLETLTYLQNLTQYGVGYSLPPTSSRSGLRLCSGMTS